MPRSNNGRRQLLDTLDQVEGVLVRTGRLFMLLIIAAVLAFAAFVFVRKPWGAGHQGEGFYFAAGVLLVLGWAVNQFLALGRRQSRHNLGTVFHSSTHDDGHTWELRLGTTADANQSETPAGEGFRFSFSKSFEIPLATVAREMLPDEDSLRRLESELADGATLERACRSVQPAFEQWSSLQQRAYTGFVARLLEERRAAQPTH